MQRLNELEREEELREAAGVYTSEPEDPEVLETRKIAVAIRKKKASYRKQSCEKRTMNYPVMPRGVGRMARRRDRDLEEEGGDSDMECDGKVNIYTWNG